MEILRVFNNNVVLARDDVGAEVILTGRGLGFQARAGQVIDPLLVARRFVPTDGRDPDHLAQLWAGIPPEHVQMVGVALAEIGLEARASTSPTLVIALADHISFALRRKGMGLDIEYPLLAEVQHLYADEYAQASLLLTSVNTRLDDPLPQSEAVALALHLVNAGFSTGDLSYTYTMTGLIQQMIGVIEQAFDLDLDPGSVNVGRFITHLRYLFVRIHQHRQLDQEHSPIGIAIRDSYPDAVVVAQRLASILELRLGSALTDDELSYLTLHLARVSSDH
ncbi:MAG TPA: PRD domain-containing protein [Propionibacteriaceae bacterium]|nr:PRD domain-containing protein [Propionibacteriaceae bacterium]